MDGRFDITDWRWWTVGGGALIGLYALIRGRVFLPREVQSRDQRILELKAEIEGHKLEIRQARLELRQRDIELKRWMELALRGTHLVEKGVQVAKAIDREATQKP